MLSLPHPGKLYEIRCKVAGSCPIRQWPVGSWNVCHIQVLLAFARTLDLQHGNIAWSSGTCCTSLCQPLQHYQQTCQNTNTNWGAVAPWSPSLCSLRWRAASQPVSYHTTCHQALFLVGSFSIWWTCWYEPPAGSATAEETSARSTEVTWLGLCWSLQAGLAQGSWWMAESEK